MGAQAPTRAACQPVKLDPCATTHPPAKTTEGCFWDRLTMRAVGTRGTDRSAGTGRMHFDLIDSNVDGAVDLAELYRLRLLDAKQNT